MSVISKEQDMMIDLLLQGEQITDIAKIVGVNRSTIYVWKDKPYIKAELDRRRQDLKKTAHNIITRDICTYVDNIKDLANNSTDQRVRLQANKYLIDQCLGSPTTAKEETINTDIGDKDKDSNTLKNELNEIKNLSLVK